jgi:PLD-like domain
MNKLDHLLPIIRAHAAELKKPGVASIRPGYRMQQGWPTKEPAIVVIISQDAGDDSLPRTIQGIPVDVRRPTDVEELRFREPSTFSKLAAQRTEFRVGAFAEVDPVAEAEETPARAQPAVDRSAAKPQLPYTAPKGVKLKRVSGKIAIICHASPDAGFPTLRSFLGATKSTLTVGIYDFTSRHILNEVEKNVLGKQLFRLTLDNPAKNPTADLTDSETLQALSDALGDEFKSAWALVRSNRAAQTWIYPTAYHIKVAIRDSAAMWLSSGNWNNANQPDMDPINNPNPQDQDTARKSDRDWHVIVEHPGLARTYEAFLKHDFEVAHGAAAGGPGLRAAEPEVALPEALRAAAKASFQFHPPLRIDNERVTITPLLTPDAGVYQPAMLKLIRSARTRLYIQLQYIHPSDKDEDADFTALIDAVADRIQAGVDVRIILSQWQASNGWLERLQAAGIDLEFVKIQNGLHNKGFVVDSKVVALGSQNWSGEGVLRNRDASVIIRNATAAKYYEQIFLHDWEKIARQSTHQ